MSTNEALIIENLTHRYKDNWSVKNKTAVDSLSLSVKAGEAFGFLGHNGAGKTTTIKCILGLAHPSSGKIRIFGQDSKDPQSRRAVGYLPEQPYFYDHLTVFETLEMFGKLSGLKGTVLKERILETLTRVNISERMDHKMRSLSKGVTQRVGLAQSLLSSPRLLILDEPFSGLDPIGRREFREILLAEKASGVTIFMSSHILSDVEAICERASILAHGTLRGVFELGSKIFDSENGGFELTIESRPELPSSLISLASSRATEVGVDRLRFDKETDANQALRLSLEHNIRIISFERQRRSLEDLFMQLVTKSGN